MDYRDTANTRMSECVRPGICQDYRSEACVAQEDMILSESERCCRVTPPWSHLLPPAS